MLHVFKYVLWVIVICFVLVDQAAGQKRLLLSQNSNYSILELPDGRMAISSINGLNILNGFATDVLRSSTHHLADDIITGELVLGPKNNLWFTTNSGLHLYDIKRDTVIRITIDYEGKRLTSEFRIIRKIEDSFIALSINDNIFLFDMNLLNYRHICRFKMNEFLSAFTNNSSENLEIVTIESQRAIAYSDRNNYSPQIIPGAFKSSLPSDQYLWLGDYSGTLYCLTPHDHTQLLKQKISNNEIQSIRKHETDVLKITTSSELILYDIAEKRVIRRHEFKTEKGQKLTNIFASYIASNGLAYISNDGQGVFLYDLHDSPFQSFSDANRVQTVSSIIPIDEAQCYLACRENGLSSINTDNDDIQTYSIPNELSSYVNFRSMVRRDSQHLVILNWINMLEFDTKKKTFKKLPFHLPGSYQVGSIRPNELFISNGKPYISRIRWTEHSVSLDTMIMQEDTTCYIGLFQFDSDGKLYATRNSKDLLIYDETFSSLLNTSTVGGYLMDLKDLGDEVLITCSAGLYRIQKDSLRPIQVIDEQRKLLQPLYALEVDRMGHYWISSNNGLFNYNPETNTVKQFTVRHGLPGQEFCSNSSYTDMDGTMYFGSEKGLVRFHPDSISLSDEQTKVDLYGLKVNDVSTSQHGPARSIENLVVPWTENTLSFEFAAIDFLYPEECELKYKLEGFDDDWIETNSNPAIARYANLPHGHYTFHIQASNTDKVWSSNERTLNVRVLPAFWQTTWFRLVAIILALGLIYLIVRRYIRNSLRQQQHLYEKQQIRLESELKLQQERNRIADELHDEIGGKLSSIKFASKKIKRAKSIDDVRGVSVRVSELSNELIDSMRAIIWAMDTQNDTIQSFVSKVREYASSLAHDNDIRIEYDLIEDHIKQEMKGQTRHHTFLVIKELLNNILKHSGANVINLSMALEDDQLQIEIKDNGKGFEMDDKLKKGKGLDSMHRRIQQVGGTMEMTTMPSVTTRLSIPII